jgi:hypothetical protein
MAETTTLRDYLAALRAALAGSDPALVQDALYGAEEYIRGEAARLAGERGQEASEEELMASVEEKYGTPAEVAAAYRDNEVAVAAALAQPAATGLGEGPLARLLAPLVEPRAYGALFFMFLSLLTGIVYFTWVTTGLSLSLGLSILIFGLPFFLFFLATVRALSLVEGRLVESLLGVRMPRKPPVDKQGTLLERLKYWLTDGRTWSAMLYMVLKLPLGIVSFTLFTVLLSLSLGFMAAPFAQLFFNQPILSLGSARVYVPLWALPLFWLVGALALLVAFHLAQALGRVFGSLAKGMLVEQQR